MPFWVYGLDNETQLPTDPLFSEASTEEEARAEAAAQGMFVQLVHKVLDKSPVHVEQDGLQDVLGAIRLTDRAEKVMQLATEEAVRLHHEYMGTEHILLGLVKEGYGVAANVLANLDIDLNKIRSEVETIVTLGPGMPITDIGALTPRAKQAIKYSIEEVRNLNDKFLDTEHLLVGLLREEGGVAAEVLLSLGLDLEDVRQAVETERMRSGIELSLPAPAHVRDNVQAGKPNTIATGTTPGPSTGPSSPKGSELTVAAIAARIRLERDWRKVAAWTLFSASILMILLYNYFDSSSVIISSKFLHTLFGLLAILCLVGSLMLVFRQLPSARWSALQTVNLTDRAEKVMQLATEEAVRLHHEYISTEHILLGLVKEGSGAVAHVVKMLGIDLPRIRLEVEKIVPQGLGVITMGKLLWTPQAEKVIEYSIEEARNLNHNHVGTEHLLLGLLREQEGVAAQVLMNLGLKLKDIREALLDGLLANLLEDLAQAGRGSESSPGRADTTGDGSVGATENETNEKSDHKGNTSIVAHPRKDA